MRIYWVVSIWANLVSSSVLAFKHRLREITASLCGIAHRNQSKGNGTAHTLHSGHLGQRRRYGCLMDVWSSCSLFYSSSIRSYELTHISTHLNFWSTNKVCSWIEEAQSYFMDASHSIWRLDINICQQHKLLLATFHNTSTTFSSYSFSLFLSFFLVWDWMGVKSKDKVFKGSGQLRRDLAELSDYVPVIIV